MSIVSAADNDNNDIKVGADNAQLGIVFIQPLSFEKW